MITTNLRRRLGLLVGIAVLAAVTTWPAVARADDGRFYPTGHERIDATRKAMMGTKSDAGNAIARGEAMLAWTKLLILRLGKGRRAVDEATATARDLLEKAKGGDRSAAAELAVELDELFPSLEKAWTEASAGGQATLRPTGKKKIDRARQAALLESTTAETIRDRIEVLLDWAELIEKAWKGTPDERLAGARSQLLEAKRTVKKLKRGEEPPAGGLALVDQAFELFETLWGTALNTRAGFVPTGSARVDENRREVASGTPTDESNVVPRAMAAIEWTKIIQKRGGSAADGLGAVGKDVEMVYEQARKKKDWAKLIELVDSLYGDLERRWLEAASRG